MPTYFPLIMSGAGDPARTVKYTFTANTPVGLLDILGTDGLTQDIGGGQKAYARAVMISVETNDVRVALGGADPSAGIGHVLAADTYMYFVNREALRTMQLANSTAGSNAVLQITVEF